MRRTYTEKKTAYALVVKEGISTAQCSLRYETTRWSTTAVETEGKFSRGCMKLVLARLFTFFVSIRIVFSCKKRQKIQKTRWTHARAPLVVLNTRTRTVQ